MKRSITDPTVKFTLQQSLTFWIHSHVPLGIMTQVPSLLWAVSDRVGAVLLPTVETLDLLSFFSCIAFFIAVALATIFLAQIVCPYFSQKRDQEGFQLPACVNRKEGKQFHAFEIQEVLILFLLMIGYKFKRVMGQLDRLSQPGGCVVSFE